MTPPEGATRVERVIRFPRPLYARVKRHARRTGRSVNAEVMVAVEAHLERENGGRR